MTLYQLGRESEAAEEMQNWRGVGANRNPLTNIASTGDG